MNFQNKMHMIRTHTNNNWHQSLISYVVKFESSLRHHLGLSLKKCVLTSCLSQVEVLWSPWHRDRVLQSVPGSSGVFLWGGHLLLPERPSPLLPLPYTQTSVVILLPPPSPEPHPRDCQQLRSVTHLPIRIYSRVFNGKKPLKCTNYNENNA